MSKWLFHASDVLDKISRFLMAGCFALAFVATIYQVISRYGVNNSFIIGMLPNFNISALNFPWLEELIRYLFVWGVFLGIGIVYKTKGHAQVEIILNIVPQQFKNTVHFIIEIFSSALFITLCVKGLDFARLTSEKGQVSSMLRMDMSVMYLSIVIFSLICFIHSLAFMAKIVTDRKAAYTEEKKSVSMP